MSKKTEKIVVNKLFVDDYACVENLTVKDDLNVAGDLRVKGNICFENEIKSLSVPTDHATLTAALNYVFGPGNCYKKIKIVLENQGPHVIIPGRYTSLSMEYLSIEAKTMTDHMGMYYGHELGSFSMFGNKGETNTAVSGSGPFSVVLSAGNTVITVTGSETNMPWSNNFGLGPYGCVKSPGWVVGVPTGGVLGISPNFIGLTATDTIRWFNTATNLITNHTIVSASGNTLTVTPAIPGSAVRGCGFSVMPRATVVMPPAPLIPEIVMNGILSMVGLQFASQTPAPFYSVLIFDVKEYVDIRKCLIHSQLVSAAGSRMFALTPNTIMDDTNGVCPARYVVNAGGAVFGFRQNYIGPSAGLWTYGSNGNTMCFSTWVNCSTGVFMRARSACKLDLAEYVKCQTGVSCDGFSVAMQAGWFDSCNTAIKLRNSSGYDNATVLEFGPLPVFPMVVDGNGSGLALDFDYNSQMHTELLRIADVTTHATFDGVPTVIPTVTAVDTLTPAGYGVRKSGIVFNTSDLSTSSCP
jgi:hypothetical protein